MRFDTTTQKEDLAYNPSDSKDDRDEFFKRNTIRRKRRLQKITIKGFELILDPDTKEIFDAQAFEDNYRLLKLGVMESQQIIWFKI